MIPFRTLMLGEVGTTAYKAVRIGQGGGSDRLVYFSTQEAMQRAIQTGTHREYDPQSDAHLAEPSSVKGDAPTGTDKIAPSGQKTPQPRSDEPHDSTDNIPTTFDTKPTSPSQPRPQHPAAEPEPEVTAMDKAEHSLSGSDKAMFESVKRTTRAYWKGPLTKLASSFAAGDAGDPKVKHKERFMKLMDAFADADTIKKQTKIVERMIRSKYIAIDEDPTKLKVYLETSKLGMDQEFLSRNRTKAAKELSALIHATAIGLVEAGKKSGAKLELKLELKTYSKKHFGAKAHVVGLHNEYGVAHHLQNLMGEGSTRNEELDGEYKSVRSAYKRLSGNDFKQHKFNQEAAQAIVDSFVGEGGTLTGVQIVGRSERYIDPMDPTDLKIAYTRDGQNYVSNISLKNLVGPKSITLRTIGTSSGTTLGDMIGGRTGKLIDGLYTSIMKPEDQSDENPDSEPTTGGDDEFEIDDLEDDIETMEAFPPKPNLDDEETYKKVKYTRGVANFFSRLQGTEEGQQQLQKLWKDLHGCDKGVSIIITNNHSGQINKAGTDDYCGPGKIQIGYHSRRITMRMMEKDNKSSYLEFNYRKRKQKSGNEIGQIQVLRKFGDGKKINKDKTNVMSKPTPTSTPIKLGSKFGSGNDKDDMSDMISNFETLSEPNPLSNNERILGKDGKKAGVKMYPTFNGIHIEDLRSITRGGGREAMTQIADMADEYNVALTGWAIPLPSSPDGRAGKKLTVDRLKKWYAEFGFKQLPDGTMRRDPQTKEK